MAWYNPWAEIRELKYHIAQLQIIVAQYEEWKVKLEFTKKENEREIRMLENELKAAKVALAEAVKNDSRDSKGRFTKAKN